MKKHRTNKVTAGALVAVMALGSLVMAAAAAQAGLLDSYTTKSSLEYQDSRRDARDKFHGQVTSGNEDCEIDRRVKVFKKNRNGTTTKIGADWTSASGTWSVSKKDATGKYFVTVDKVILLDEYGDALGVCKPYSSIASVLSLR